MKEKVRKEYLKKRIKLLEINLPQKVKARNKYPTNITCKELRTLLIQDKRLETQNEKMTREKAFDLKDDADTWRHLIRCHYSRVYFNTEL